jgi:hypothetical protein
MSSPYDYCEPYLHTRRWTDHCNRKELVYEYATGGGWSLRQTANNKAFVVLSVLGGYSGVDREISQYSGGSEN